MGSGKKNLTTSILLGDNIEVHLEVNPMPHIQMLSKVNLEML